MTLQATIFTLQGDAPVWWFVFFLLVVMPTIIGLGGGL